MEILQMLFEGLQPVLPLGAAIIGVVLVLFGVRYILEKRQAGRPGYNLRRQMITLSLSFIGLLIIIMTLPVSDTTIGQLLSLIGILLSAAIALSAPTFVGNIMAGMMLRAVRSFRPGDFIRVGDYFGRVSEQGLFHVEIQTEDRDLTTMPNLYLIANPVKVIRSSGTIISADVSLGYDIPRTKIEGLLIEAALAAGLEEPFVLVTALGDFAVSYRVAGLLQEVKHVLSTRSTLHEQMLDKLHGGGVEIVSPTFMNTRAISGTKKSPPTAEQVRKKREEPIQAVPEEIVFDKAEEAQSLERLREVFESLGREIEAAGKHLQQASGDSERKALEERINTLKRRQERLAGVLKRIEEKDET
jgi:small-conductance mechanosensitive channel